MTSTPPLRGLSLERKLQLLMAGVLTAIIAMTLVLSYGALTWSARETLRSRLTRSARVMASTVELAMAARRARLADMAASPEVKTLLAAAVERGTTDSAQRQAARAAIARLSLPDEDRFPLELWSETGTHVLHLGATLPDEDERSARSGVHPVRRDGLGAAQLADSVFAGSLFVRDGRAVFWVVAAVMDDGRRLGYVAQRIRVGSQARATESLRDLIGEQVTYYSRNMDGSLWIDPAGAVATSRMTVDTTGEDVVLHRGVEEDALVGESSIGGTPWVVAVAGPLSSVQSRARRVVVILAFLSLPLVLVGSATAWYLGRRITRPLASLTDAAESIAARDYTRRVEAGGRDEIGRLALAFNTMAHEVESGRQALEERVRDTQWGAEELERTNRQLLDSMIEAEYARREAEEARADAERANRAKSDFLAVMSHELRTPLNAIGGYAQLIDLEIHGPVTPAQHDALQRIARSQAHLLRLINDVLYFARIDASQVQYSITDLPLDEALATAEPLVAPQVRDKHLSFTYHGCDAELAVRADRDRLQQIILNLLTNAIKFTPEGGAVSVHCDVGEETVQIRVRDTGVGIPAERLEAVFDPFIQVDRGRHRPHDGVGLGLAISRDLAHGMGGELSVESTVGEGSTFTLTLPRVTTGTSASAATGDSTGTAPTMAAAVGDDEAPEGV